MARDLREYAGDGDSWPTPEEDDGLAHCASCDRLEWLNDSDECATCQQDRESRFTDDEVAAQKRLYGTRSSSALVETSLIPRREAPAALDRPGA